ncbi:MAG: hypothetical protein GXP53_06755 [Deltaproteobacteria bacterium]|nr:hypothetical protein [Deltaproteobacteria bacterium]
MGISILKGSKKYFVITCVIAVLFWSALSSAIVREQHSTISARLGINLAGPSDWNTELPFVDVFRMSRPWISQRVGSKWGKGPELSLDAHGWIKKLDPGCRAETLLCNIKGGHYPSGNYTVLYDGKGKISFKRAATIISSKPGRIIIHVNSDKGGFSLLIDETDPQNYIRNIRVIMPGFEDKYRENPFHPDFLTRWHGIACIRFMNWMKTNGSQISKWSDRPTLMDATFSNKGVALEWMIDLCNRLGADPWFCIPHQADDEYVDRFARLVKETLDPGLKVYIEYSNEVWNSRFAQNKYAARAGRNFVTRGGKKEAAARYTAYRSIRIFKIWEGDFKGTSRLVRVLPSQAADPYLSRMILESFDAWKYADALAIAPYISCRIYDKDRGKGLSAVQVEKWTVDRILDYMETTSLPTSIDRIRKNKQVAEKYGLRLIAYEGGQHMVGLGRVVKNAKVTQLLHAANAHPQMGKIYQKYLEAWEKEGGGLFCHFSSIGKWTKWGSWGLMQYYDDDPAKSPKFRAVMQWAEHCGQLVRVPDR